MSKFQKGDKVQYISQPDTQGIVTNVTIGDVFGHISYIINTASHGDILVAEVNLEAVVVEKTLDNLEVGDVVVSTGVMFQPNERTVIDVFPNSYLLSDFTSQNVAGKNWGKQELKDKGYIVKKPSCTPKSLSHTRQDRITNLKTILTDLLNDTSELQGRNGKSAIDTACDRIESLYEYEIDLDCL